MQAKKDKSKTYYYEVRSYVPGYNSYLIKLSDLSDSHVFPATEFNFQVESPWTVEGWGGYTIK